VRARGCVLCVCEGGNHVLVPLSGEKMLSVGQTHRERNDHTASPKVPRQNLPVIHLSTLGTTGTIDTAGTSGSLGTRVLRELGPVGTIGRVGQIGTECTLDCKAYFTLKIQMSHLSQILKNEIKILKLIFISEGKFTDSCSLHTFLRKYCFLCCSIEF
jgi:hypothetical protein